MLSHRVYTLAMYRMLGTAIVVGLISPLFWLGVNILENRIRSLLSHVVANRKARRAAAELRGQTRVGLEQIDQ